MSGELRHGRVKLSWSRLRDGEGPPLLLLHELRGSRTDWASGPSGWPGPVHALDLSGHGDSGWVHGGAYYPELLAGDADIALEELGEAVLAGAGVGAYAALLLAGARPDAVPAAVLLPGAGLAGGGPRPEYEQFGYDLDAPEPGASASDPLLVPCERYVRPPDYAADFAAAARRLLLVETGAEAPPWWQVVREAPGAESAPDLETALSRLARG